MIITSRPLEVALIAACSSYAGEVVSWLEAKEYLTVPAEEVIAELSKLPSPSIVSARSAAMKKVRASRKTAEIPMEKGRNKPEMLLPFCGVIEESWCMGIRFNHGLHTQCTNAPTDGKYCKTCAKSAKNSASGKPTYGDIQDRLVGELLEFRDPKGKLTTCYANVAKKLGLDIEKAQVEAANFGWTIPENQLEVIAPKRGRPASKKPKVVKPKGKRGRPAKKVSESKTNSMDAQIAQLVAEAAEDVLGEQKSAKKIVRKTAAQKEAEKLAKKQAKEAEKLAKKQAKEAEKAAKKAAKKQAKEAEKAAKKAAKEAEKEAKKAAKEAEKAAKEAAKKAAKEAEKAAKKAAKEAKKAQPSKTELKKKQLQKEAKDIGCEIADEQLKTLKIGEIRQMIKAHKKSVKEAKKKAPKKVTHTLMGECTIKSVTLDVLNGGSAMAVEKADKVAKETEQNEGFYLVNYHPYRIPATSKPKTTEEKVDDAIAELDEELMVDSSDEEAEEAEEDDELQIDPETTPKVTIDGVDYYKVTAYGTEGLLFSMEGDLIGAHNEEDNTILEVEMDDE